MDDANVPNLISIPYLGCVKVALRFSFIFVYIEKKFVLNLTLDGTMIPKSMPIHELLCSLKTIPRE